MDQGAQWAAIGLDGLAHRCSASSSSSSSTSTSSSALLFRLFLTVIQSAGSQRESQLPLSPQTLRGAEYILDGPVGHRSVFHHQRILLLHFHFNFDLYLLQHVDVDHQHVQHGNHAPNCVFHRNPPKYSPPTSESRDRNPPIQ